MNGVQEHWRYVFYKAASGRVPVKEFIEQQSAEVREKIYDDLKRLVEYNIALGYPFVLKVEGRAFWELRTRAAKDVYRTFYFAHTGKKFVLLHASRSKAGKLPRGSWTALKSG